MKTYSQFSIAMIFAVGGAIGFTARRTQPTTPHLSEPALLRSIAQVESGGRLDAVGKHGELGEYQLEPVIIFGWEVTYGRHFDYSDKTQTEVATCWLHQWELKSQTFDPRTLFTLWNPGQPEETTQREMNLYQQNLNQK